MSVGWETMRISLKESPRRSTCVLPISKEMTCMSRERVSYSIDVHPVDQHGLLGNDNDNTSSFTSSNTREYPEKHNNGEGEGEEETCGEQRDETCIHELGSGSLEKGKMLRV
ncbi:Hypothetical predicted protein [Prunus dulcis]|uniref:Uncharacterized protein n=1 Tax=Prunus dulcis TaxID=3755 RepID=A0A5E4GLB9_PRUDU|nr:Hypothetical predicted protein [Prunus dulcis]